MKNLKNVSIARLEEIEAGLDFLLFKSMILKENKNPKIRSVAIAIGKSIIISKIKKLIANPHIRNNVREGLSYLINKTEILNNSPDTQFLREPRYNFSDIQQMAWVDIAKLLIKVCDKITLRQDSQIESLKKELELSPSL